ncbi:MAG: PQQ-binding-like beta-propeller repeat protein [Thermoguttaceae bacterium]|nr:PQQ-binding-like beta-propeller repeat protein [Thermoguttaceae bacterium]
MMMIAKGHPRLIMVMALLTLGPCGADWPTWRYDAGRTASTPERLPEELKLCWSWQFPPLEPAFSQVRQERQQFDSGYEPVVSGRLLLVGSSRNDSLTALDVNSGDEVWRFYAEGPGRRISVPTTATSTAWI